MLPSRGGYNSFVARGHIGVKFPAYPDLEIERLASLEAPRL